MNSQNYLFEGVSDEKREMLDEIFGFGPSKPRISAHGLEKVDYLEKMAKRSKDSPPRDIMNRVTDANQELLKRLGDTAGSLRAIDPNRPMTYFADREYGAGVVAVPIANRNTPIKYMYFYQNKQVNREELASQLDLPHTRR